MSKKTTRKYLEWDKTLRQFLPIRQGVYFVKGIYGNNVENIDVYSHPIKGLCVFGDDYGGEMNPPVDDETDCHISVQCTGLEFIAWKGNIVNVGG